MTGPDTVLLQADRITAVRGGVSILRGVSMQARSGSWLAVVGPNGAGKSTLLRCLAGLLPVEGGEVQLKGRGLRSWSARPRARVLAWMGQHHDGDDSMRVRDAVALGRMPYQGALGLASASRSDLEAIEQALEDTDMLDKADRTLGSLSGGERQRVSLARTLAVQADVLLLDEPVAHLDAPHQRLLAQVIQRETARGCAVISVLHELPLALHADQLLVMQGGQVLAQGASDDNEVHRAIESVFDHAIEIKQVASRWVVLPRY
ncbi:MAG: ABC transporter ATP-binding protein [Burkholderiales bacterium]|nr:ABC transporter ATP-binding protein [Burkholderiales bacterium]